MTKMMQRMAGRRKAATKVSASMMKRRMVATTRTGLNMVSSCFLKPLRVSTTSSVNHPGTSTHIKKPVPTREMIVPTAKRAVRQ